MTIWHLRIVRWISKAINIFSEYTILIAFLLQKSLHERASKSRDNYIAYWFPFYINSHEINNIIKFVVLEYQSKKDRKYWSCSSKSSCVPESEVEDR